MESTVPVQREGINDQLENERLKLLKSIQNQSGSAYRPEHGEELKILRNRYNQIVINQRDSRRGPCTDPLSVLPVEVWVHIIDEIVECGWGSAYRAVSNMVLVSKKWRDVIVSTPRFWTQITINPGYGESDLLQRITTALYLSTDQNLTVNIEYPISRSSYDSYAALLFPHSTRIRRIIFRDCSWIYRSSSPLDPTVHQILSDFLPLPQLEGIQFTGRFRLSEEEWNIIEAMPNLKVLEGDTVAAMPLSVLKRISLVNLKTLTFHGTVNQLFSIITDLPRLKTLTMIEPPYHNRTPEDPSTTYDRPLPEQALSMDTLDWRKQRGTRFQDLIRCSPYLKHLTLLASWKLLGFALDGMNYLPLLSYLSIKMQYLLAEDEFIPTNVIQNTSIQELSLNFAQFGSSGPSGFHSLQHSKLSQFIDSWLPTIKQLKKFSVVLPSKWAMPPVLLANLAYLRALTLTLPDLGDAIAPNLAFDALENLDLAVPPTDLELFLSSLTCPNLLLLNIRTSPLHLRKKVAIQIHSQQFPKLSSLHWDSSEVVWDVSSLEALKLVSFQDDSSQSASDFCAHLILRPCDFPALEELKFYKVPEWDLLFLMLERRNFLQDQAISKITMVTLSTTVGAILKGPLTSLLRGEFTNRLSNRDLSIVGLGEIYFDETLPGCHWCCLSMRACSLPAARMSYRSSVLSLWSNLRGEPVNIIPDPPLTDSVIDWLGRRQERYDYWRERENNPSSMLRNGTCDTHRMDSLYVFSEFSLTTPPRFQSIASIMLEPVFD
ncbi:hypothetical protein FRC20_003456 [Serendipita sp. 405]|nr:hypothetical protein FRC20_003456 [Serendipita sp. 405]